MHVRWAIVLSCLSLALAAYYAASPLLAAHKLREAIRAGDTRTLESLVDWTTLRASVRDTVAQNAQLLPAAKRVARSVTPTLWQRMRSVFGHSMLDRFIEHYITPKGLPELYRAKHRWHGTKPDPNPSVIEASIVPDNLARAWRRIKRAEFVSPYRFILEMEDRHRASRLIQSTFELSRIGLFGIDWKLMTISIRNKPQAKAHPLRLNGF